MIYVLIYCAIGAIVTLRLPLQRARFIHKLHSAEIDPERFATLTTEEKAVLSLYVASVRKPFKTWQLVLGGVVWPVQVIAIVVAQVWRIWFRWRVNKPQRRR